jgi:hypothetical protein
MEVYIDGRPIQITKSLWQIPTGDGSRNFSKECIKYGVVLMGYGRLGDLNNDQCRRDNFISDEQYKKDQEIIFPKLQKLKDEIKVGDWVVLKHRLDKITALGKIKSGYKYREEFDGIAGWDLQHTFEAEWYTPIPSNNSDKPPILTPPKSSLIKGSLPKKCRSELSKFLTDKQFISTSLPEKISKKKKIVNLPAGIIQTYDQLKPLINHYRSHRDYWPTEHETRTFLVIPLLQALGWAPQDIRIEYNHLDIVLFATNRNEPILIIETKRLGSGFLRAIPQAEEYANRYNNCPYFIVTDGIRYEAYQKKDKQFDYRSSLDLYDLSGSIDVLNLMKKGA